MLTLRRVVALIGVDGVRAAANSLRVWPGPLDDDGATALHAAIDRVRLAGHLAQALRPAGYDARGRLPRRGAAEPRPADAALPLRRRGRADPPADAAVAGAPRRAEPAEQPGLDEDAAAYAVLGVDIEAFGIAVARHWGLGDEMLHMIRRLPVDAPVRKPDGDADLLRIVASAANEIVDVASHVPAKRCRRRWTTSRSAMPGPCA